MTVSNAASAARSTAVCFALIVGILLSLYHPNTFVFVLGLVLMALAVAMIEGFLLHLRMLVQPDMRPDFWHVLRTTLLWFSVMIIPALLVGGIAMLVSNHV